VKAVSIYCECGYLFPFASFAETQFTSSRRYSSAILALQMHNMETNWKEIFT